MRDPVPAGTIFALASGQGTAGIAVVRVSGPAADEVLLRIAPGPLPAPRLAVVRAIRDGAEVIDEALLLRFTSGQGYTGEPAFEVHCHGGRAVVLAVLDLLARQPECRMADPGEFTRRALENGRLDLVSVEALGDLISAETELQRRQAVRMMAGGLQQLADGWRDRLIRAQALIEVTIDWVDEDVPEDVVPEVGALIASVREELAAQRRQAARVDRLRLGYEVALVGAPNAGKSSLLNALAGREAAIASEIAGTTRDVIELRYDLDGLPIVFLDMAGLRETDDPVESLGVARARERAEGAALRLFLVAPDTGPASRGGMFRDGDLVVATKSDLGGVAEATDLAVSSRTGSGVAELLAAIAGRLRASLPDEGLIGHARQMQCVDAAMTVLDDVERSLQVGELELVAEDLRRATRALDRLIGRVDAEAVLDRVFASFCLGK